MGNSAPHMMNRVVLADDDGDHAIIFKKVLQTVDQSRQLTIVRDGEELIRLLSTQVPELLFLDLNMPCKNGLECLQDIRQNLNLSDLPVVVYSSSTHMTDIQKSYIHRADLYLVKPFNSFHLKNALESILKMEWRNKIPEKYYFINNKFVPFTA